MKRVLLIAFHFPPLGTSSGLHRTVSLAKHLHRFGWEPLVLTANRRAYPDLGPESDPLLPASVQVMRSFALDTARHLAIRGRYPRALALPDRWVSWLAGAVPMGLRIIRRYKPRLIWSTYPLATAHLIGYVLSKMTGLPWAADFRDPMVECIDGEWFPQDSAIRHSRLFVEKRVASAASGVSFCTSSALRIFSDRHLGWQQSARCSVIENGYDSEAFDAAEIMPFKRDPNAIHLVHSGTLYPGPDRDPSALFQAMARLRERGKLPANLRVTLRATGFDSAYLPIIERLNLSQFVNLAPSVDYSAALREMLDADGLLLFQGHTSNPAIPAKAYEYLRARKPILALAAEDGETARLLNRAQVGVVAPIDNPDRIELAFDDFLERLSQGSHPVLSATDSEAFSRVYRVREFASFFDGFIAR